MTTGTHPTPGDPLTTKSRFLETSAAATQDFSPVKQICAHINGFHVYASDPTRCVEANHYCSHLTEGNHAISPIATQLIQTKPRRPPMPNLRHPPLKRQTNRYRIHDLSSSLHNPTARRKETLAHARIRSQKWDADNAHSAWSPQRSLGSGRDIRDARPDPELREDVSLLAG